MHCQNMLSILEQVPPHTAFSDSKLNQQLETVIHLWKMLATQVQDILHIHEKKPGLISNPYNAGPALKPVHNSPKSRVCWPRRLVEETGVRHCVGILTPLFF